MGDLNKWTGILIPVITASFAILISEFIGINLLGFNKSPVSPIIVSILLGLLLNNSFNLFKNYDSGYQYCIKYILKFGIILLGVRLSLFQLYEYGSKSIFVVIPCILLTIFIVSHLSKHFKVSDNLSSLIAVGTSICGATAIVALAPMINAKKTEITYAVANITIFGLLAMFLYPFLANWAFNNDDLSIGLFLGSSIHETAQVAGSALIYEEQYLSKNVVAIATLTKLVRNTLMVIVIPYLAHKSLDKGGNENYNIKSIFPFFIIGFILFGVFRTIGDYYFSENHSYLNEWEIIIANIKRTAEYLLITAMAAVGYNTNLKYFKELGILPFYIGIIAAISVGLISLVMINLIV